jgi:DNA processing protein
MGITVISGMARGIDTSAHKGALKSGGRTIAVLGSGLNVIYPAQNKDLFGRIAESGAVISEFPMLTRPLAKNFPRRNRIISGLSIGVVVVEAARNSGALITADFALEQSREVFAVPGKIDSFNSFGTNRLIKQGAKLVESVEDIIEELEPRIRFHLRQLKDKKPTEPNKVAILDLTSKEGAVYNNLTDTPKYIDEIIVDSGLSATEVLAILLRMEIKHLIRQLPGKLFVRNYA